MMKTNQLGNSDLHFTVVGLGTWAIGGGGDWGWGPQDDADSIAAVQQALDEGINWLDTAASYGHGRSESVVGEAIKERRDQVYVATKGGIVWDENKENFFRMKAWSLREEAENSLDRLGVDQIDLYQIHWNEPDEDIEEGWTEVARLIEEGKVRYGGVSNWSVSQMERALAIHPITSLQPQYNMLDRTIEDEILPFCAENNIGVIVYSTMAAGLLTGKFTKEKVAALPDDDWRSRHNEHFKEPELSVNLDFIEKLRPIAERNEITLGQLAIGWVLRRPEITAAIVGARRPQQVKETAQAGSVSLSQADLDEIEALLKERERKLAS